MSGGPKHSTHAAADVFVDNDQLLPQFFNSSILLTDTTINSYTHAYFSLVNRTAIDVTLGHMRTRLSTIIVFNSLCSRK